MFSRQCGLLRGSFTRFTLRPRVEIRATLGVTWQKKKKTGRKGAISWVLEMMIRWLLCFQAGDDCFM